MSRIALCAALAASAAVPATASATAGYIYPYAGTGASGSTGDGAAATLAKLDAPAGAAFGPSGDFYFVDQDAHVGRKVSAAGIITKFAGVNYIPGSMGEGGNATSGLLYEPTDVAVDAGGNIYISDFVTRRVRKVDTAGKINTVAGTGDAGHSGDGGPAILANIGSPTGLAIDSAGNLIIADLAGWIRKVTPTGTITTIAGDGTAASTGDGGMATAAALNQPAEVAFDGAGNLYVAELGGHRVRRITPGGVISRFAGTGTPASTGDNAPATSAALNAPIGLAADSKDNVFIAESGGARIRKVDAAGTITRVAGIGTTGDSGDGGPATGAQMTTPTRITLGATGDLYIPDIDTHRIRRVEGAGAPAAPVMSQTSPTSPANANSLQVRGTAAAGSTVTLYTNAACTTAVSGGTATAAQFASPGIATTVADNSTTSYYATATLDGVVSGCSPTPATFVEDSTGPAAPSFSLEPPASGYGRSPSWGFYGETGATYQCRFERGGVALTGYDWASCTSPITYSLADAADGTYRFLVRPTDAAGNVGTAAQSDYVLDTVGPAAPSVDSAPDTPDTERSITWTFSGPAGTTLQCRLESEGVPLAGYDWSTCSGSRNYSLAGKADGTYRFVVRAADAAGNTGNTAQSDYVLDTVAPGSPSFTAEPASPDSDRTPSWTFTTAAGTASTRCRLERGGSPVTGADWGSCTGSFTHDLAGQPDGSYTLLVEPTDAAGNVGAPAASIYILDAAAPPQPTIDTSPGPRGNDRTIAWAFSGGGSRFECRLAGPNGVVDDWTACSGTAAYDLDGLPNGAYVFSVKAFSATNSEGAVRTDTYVLDTVAPGLPGIDSAPVSPSQSRALTWTFTAEAGADAVCRLDSGSTVISNWTSCAGGASYSLTGRDDGTYVFRVKATDQAGNPGGERTSSYVLDTTAPSAPSIGAEPASPSTGRSPAWSFTADAGTVVTCRLQRDGADEFGWAPCDSQVSFDLSGRPDGDYTFAVRATDAASNTSAAVSATYTLDTTAPGSTVIDSAPPAVGRDRTLVWGFGGEGLASFECTLERGGENVFEASPCVSPRTFDLGGMADGRYRFSVTGRDAAGNAGAATTYDYQLDTVAPAAPSIRDKPAATGRALKPAVSFTGEAGATFQCRLERAGKAVQDWGTCESPRTFVLSAEAEGSYKMLVRSVDAAGNAGPSAAASYVLDRTDPDPPEFTTTPGAAGDDPTPRWAFKAERDATVECRLVRVGDDEPIEDWQPCKSPQSYNLGRREDGTYRVMLRTTDEAGNTGMSSRDDYELKRAGEGPKAAGPGGSGSGGGDAGPGPAAAAPAAAPATQAAAPGSAQAAEAGEGTGGVDDESKPKPMSPAEAAAAERALRGSAGPSGSSPAAAPTARGEREEKKGLARVADLPVIRNLGEAAKVIVENADKSVFPSSLLLIVGLFLLVQRRIDRGDPKLALAPAFADPDLEFLPPPSFR